MDLVNTTCSDYSNITISLENKNVSNCASDELFCGKPKQEVPSYHLSSQVTATMFFVTIFLIGVLGNVLVILVVFLHRNMKTSINMYLINLCIADILVLTVCMPTVLVDVYARDVWYFGEAMCALVPFLENTVVHASVLTLIAISVERYKVVIRPLSSIDGDMYKSIKAVPVIWFISAISNIPWFYIADYRDSKQLDGTPIKVCRLPMLPRWHKFYVTSLSVLFFLIPFLVLLFLYCRICYILQITRDVINHHRFRNSSQRLQRRRLRTQVINIIISLVLLFFVFHLPYRVVSLWFIFGDKYEIHSLGIHKYFNIIYSVRIMFYLNHAVNPIIYNFVSRKFRNALRYLLAKLGHRRSLPLSNRQRGFHENTPARPRKSQVIIVENELENNVLIDNSEFASSRYKRNEFYPMVANILNNHEKKGDSNQIQEQSNSDIVDT